MHISRSFWLGAVLAATAQPAAAQFPILKLPMESPRAQVSQTIGFTTVSVDYGRPAVKGRTIWGGQVPFNEVWRAGANENTVFEVTSPFTVAGTRLPAGKYGLHLIPTATTWTMILSKQANAWGSFSYNQAEDAVRFQVQPQPGSMVERLQYTMDDITDTSVTVTLRWEKLTAAIPVRVATAEIALDSIAQQLRGIPYFFGESWSSAGRWALQNSKRFDLAEAWADSALVRQKSFANLRLKAALLERRGDKAGADKLRAESVPLANEVELNAYGYQLMGQGQVDQALAMFQKNVKDHPDSWNTYDSLAEAYAKKGNKALAIANYKKALAMTTDQTQKRRIEAALAALN